MFDRVLMVCVGNVCRSPMAAGELAARLARRGIPAAVESAGLAALVGSPADPHAERLMRSRGVDISPHRARQLTPDLIRGADLVLVMDLSQQRAVEAMLPEARGRVHRLGRWGGGDVPDPYRGDAGAFEEALQLILRGVDALERTCWPHPP